MGFNLSGTPLVLALGTGLLAAGCGYVPKNQLTACQSQNRALAEQTKAQLAEIENLKVHTHSVEDQLIRAEEDLARLGGSGRSLTKSRSTMPSGVSNRLAQLADRYPVLQFDPKTGISKLDTDVLFDSGEVELKQSSQQMLSEFAGILRAPEARELKVMVVGHTDVKGIKGRDVRKNYPTNWHLSSGRAVTVAEQLKAAGIPEQRMGVAGFGPHQPISPNDTASSRQKNRRVEIFVVGPETPIVGWTETLESLYR